MHIPFILDLRFFFRPLSPRRLLANQIWPQEREV
jgi:hypothetical protein